MPQRQGRHEPEEAFLGEGFQASDLKSNVRQICDGEAVCTLNTAMWGRRQGL
jgi:hypothetical protein